jgi:hypothetical protein
MAAGITTNPGKAHNCLKCYIFASDFAYGFGRALKATLGAGRLVIASSKKTSMVWCGKIPFGGAGVSIGRTFELAFILSI